MLSGGMDLKSQSRSVVCLNISISSEDGGKFGSYCFIFLSLFWSGFGWLWCCWYFVISTAERSKQQQPKPKKKKQQLIFGINTLEQWW